MSNETTSQVNKPATAVPSDPPAAGPIATPTSQAKDVDAVATSQSYVMRLNVLLYAAIMACVVGGAFWKFGDTFDRGSAVWVGVVLLALGAISIIPILKAAADLRKSQSEAEYRTDLIRELAPGAARQDTTQATLEPEFFARLVKINFTYIETYYRQTQVQADKSFRLSAVAAIVSLGVTVGGIVMMYREATTRAAVITAVGAFSELVSAIFFYLYNRTVLKMGEYHQKLVITQNVALALKISETLPKEKRADAQIDLMKELSRDINKYLSGESSASETRRKTKTRSAARAASAPSHNGVP